MRQLFREPAALTVLAVAINQSLGHNLPTERTVLFIRDPRAGVKKLPTWQAKEPTPRANGNWVSGSGKGFHFGGVINNNNNARVWIRQPKANP